jgi:hypothetical protein
MIDRYGNPNGGMTAPQGTPLGERSLPPSYADQPLTTFRVVEPFEVTEGLIEPWFGEEGLGVGYLMPMSTADLVELGFLEVVP